MKKSVGLFSFLNIEKRLYLFTLNKLIYNKKVKIKSMMWAYLCNFTPVAGKQGKNSKGHMRINVFKKELPLKENPKMPFGFSAVNTDNAINIQLIIVAIIVVFVHINLACASL